MDRLIKCIFFCHYWKHKAHRGSGHSNAHSYIFILVSKGEAMEGNASKKKNTKKKN